MEWAEMQALGPLRGSLGTNGLAGWGWGPWGCVWMEIKGYVIEVELLCQGAYLGRDGPV